MNLKIQKGIITISLLLAITVIFTAGCQQQQDHSKKLKPIVERGVQVWNTGNLDVVDELWAPNV
ncbi:MAG: hypothetical protein R3250_09750, partial [Melioribacteraceae bacterium]|nr:hypothetical protein [Melioribacteraceae bacterium]